MSNNAEWANIFNSYFGTQLDQPKADFWFNELTDPSNASRIKDLTQQEICNSIRREAPGYQNSKRPALTELRQMILNGRKRQDDQICTIPDITTLRVLPGSSSACSHTLSEWKKSGSMWRTLHMKAIHPDQYAEFQAAHPFDEKTKKQVLKLTGEIGFESKAP